MTFLSPLLLLAAAAVAVPILLHLVQRPRTRRQAFPALRYLRRTEREHARRIRLRQLLLLLLRCAAVLLLAAAAARPVLRGQSDRHPPTALAIVLDNSLSSGRVTGEARLLDELRARALETLDRAGPEDRIWVLRAGEPWEVVAPGGMEEARRRVGATEVSAAAADLSATLARARELVAGSDLPAAEVHLLSDLQASNLRRPAVAGPADPGEDRAVPVVVWAPEREERGGHWLASVEVGGGLPPLAGERTGVAVAVGGTADTARVPVRLVVDGEIRAAAAARPGETVVLTAGPFPAGTVTGWVETDPDALGGDDRRYLTIPVQPPVPVARTGPSSFFLDRGLETLAEAGRVRPGPAGEARVLAAVEGEGIPRDGRPVLVVPPGDPDRLPALNRRLAEAGIPWRYEPPGPPGEAVVEAGAVPEALEGVRVARAYRLVPAEGAGPGLGDDRVWARLSGGSPFLVSGADPAAGRGAAPAGPSAHLLLAAPLDPAWTDLPVDAAMVPFLGWALARWPGGGDGPGTAEAGTPLAVPPGALALVLPDGTTVPVDGTDSFARTSRAGIHRFVRRDSTLATVAVNPPTRESLPATLDADEVAGLLEAEVVAADDPEAWQRAVFTARQGPEAWRPLLVLALLVLLAEGAFAASGAGTRASGPGKAARGATAERRRDGTHDGPQGRGVDQVGATIP